MTEKEVDDAAASIRALCLTTNTAEVEQFIAGITYVFFICFKLHNQTNDNNYNCSLVVHL